MCGRYSYFGPLDILKKNFSIEAMDWEPTPSYNVAPTQYVPAILSENGQTHLKHLHWGLIPSWAKDPAFGSRRINAREESLSEKPSFKNAFKKRRCFVVANGYYEWTGEKGAKQPYYITTQTSHPFGFAGLWEIWKDLENETLTQSCTIITTSASPHLKHIHNRMPIILAPEYYKKWLDSDIQDHASLFDILQKGRGQELIFHPVSKAVNSAKNNGPELIQAIDLG